MTWRLLDASSPQRASEIEEALDLLREVCLDRPHRTVVQTIADLLGVGPQSAYQAEDTDIIEAARAVLEREWDR